jgi:hypothetical protein
MLLSCAMGGHATILDEILFVFLSFYSAYVLFSNSKYKIPFYMMERNILFFLQKNSWFLF